MSRWLPLLFLASLLTGCTPKARTEPILIGHIVPLSGPEKVLGEHARQGIMLAVEEINKQENSSLSRKLAVLHADPHADDELLQPIAVRLITVNKVVALLGGMDFTQADQIGRAAKTYDVPVLTPAALPGISLGDNVFSLNASLAYQGEVLARFAVEELKAEKVALLTDGKQPWLEPLASAIVQELRRTKGVQVEEVAYQGSRELVDGIERLRKSAAKAVIHLGPTSDLNKAADLGATFLHVPPPSSTEAIPELKTPIYGITAWLPEGAADQKFVKAYQEKFGQTPDSAAALAYESIRLLAEVHVREQNLTATKMRADLTSGSQPFESLTGILTFDKARNAQRTVFVVRHSGGKRELAKRYDPVKK